MFLGLQLSFPEICPAAMGPETGAPCFLLASWENGPFHGHGPGTGPRAHGHGPTGPRRREDHDPSWTLPPQKCENRSGLHRTTEPHSRDQTHRPVGRLHPLRFASLRLFEGLPAEGLLHGLALVHEARQAGVHPRGVPEIRKPSREILAHVGGAKTKEVNGRFGAYV